MALIQVNMDQCKREGRCIEVCPLKILQMDPERGPQMVPGRGAFCIGCGHCVAVCPHGALDNMRNPLDRQLPLSPQPLPDPQKISDFLRSRRSVRCYKGEPVRRETLLQLLEAARYAPSAHNSQGLSYLIVEEKQHLDGVRNSVIDWMREVIRVNPEMARTYHMEEIVKACESGEDLLLRSAPHLIIAMGQKGANIAYGSTYLALEYVELYAVALGLGTCWAGYVQVCAQQYPPLSSFLRIPEDRMITGAMMVGIPKYTYHRVPVRNPPEVAWFREND